MSASYNKKINIIIDGASFSDLNGFFDEIKSKLVKDESILQIRNLSAFKDVLNGGFGAHQYGEPIKITWVNSHLSKNALGYPATIRYYESMLNSCHPSNKASVEALLEKARNHTGDTLMDMIINIINDSENNCSLILQ